MVASKVKETLLATGIDKFLEQVSKKGPIKASELAKQIDVPLSTIESWADILSKEHLVTTSYDGSGVRVISTTQENVSQKKDFARQLADNVDATISETHDSFEEKEKTLKQEYAQLRQFEDILKKDLAIVSGLESELQHLESMEKEIRTHITKVVLQEKTAAKDSKTISKLIGQKVKEIAQTEKEIEAFNKSKEKLWEDIQIIKRLSWTLKWTSAAKMSSKIQDAEKRAKEVKSLSSELGNKYKIIQKLFSKI